MAEHKRKRKFMYKGRTYGIRLTELAIQRIDEMLVKSDLGVSDLYATLVEEFVANAIEGNAPVEAIRYAYEEWNMNASVLCEVAIHSQWTRENL